MMDKRIKKLVREIVTKQRRVSATIALINALNPNLVKQLGKKYIRKGDYHWREYYCPEKTAYTVHVNYVVKFFQGKSGRLLDVGCGEGLIMNRIRETSNLECFGIDNSPLAVEYARQHLVKNCEFIDLKNFDKAGFNYVFMGDLLEHLKEPEIALQKAEEQWLVDDGLLFVACPTKRGIGDLRLFTKDSILELIGSVFAVNTLDIRPECQKMYIIAYKPEFMKELEEIRMQEKMEDSKIENRNESLKGDR